MVTVCFSFGCARPLIGEPCPGADPTCSANPADLAVEPTVDLSQPSSAAQPPDLSARIDLRAATDLSEPPRDLAPACVPTGGDCTYHKNSVCCSHYCIYSSETCR
jgi:hypothetical protein